MEYSLNTLTNDQLIELFDEIPETVFHDLIGKNQKHFEKSKYIKGFRINKLPKTIIYKMFSDEILSVPNTILERNLINIIKFNFKDTNIEAIIDSLSEDIFSTACLIEKEVISTGLTLSPAMILLIAKHSITDSEKTLIDKYHKLLLENQNTIIKRMKEEIEEKSNQKYIDLLEKYDKIKDGLSAAEKEISGLKNELHSKENIIKNNEHEINALTSKLEASSDRIDHLKKRIIEYSEKAHIISEQEKEIKLLTTQNEELQHVISKLSASALSPNCVTEMCLEIMDDLKQESIDNDEWVREAKNMFSENESILGAWLGLSDKEKEKMEHIISLMNQNTITHNDIEVLENVESYVNIKYMIVKSLIVVFYKYLEHNASHKKLVDKF